jgi:cobalt/nickel transport system permease protein
MRHDFLDRYSRGTSAVHALRAEWKLAAALGLIVATVTMPLERWPWFAGAAAGLLAVAALAHLPYGFLFRRLLTLLPLVLGVSLLALLQPGGGRVFLGLVTKSTLCICTMILLSSTTPVAALLQVLRRLRVPALFVTTLALLYRYLFVLVDESQRLGRARASRTLRPSRRRTWQLQGTGLGMLFVRTSERAERIYAAMLSRGWH